MTIYDEALDIVSELKCEPKYEYLKVQALKDLHQLVKDYKDCKNELCLKCGAYRNGGLIACENCRWYK